jgi:hypothetical protein
MNKTKGQREEEKGSPDLSMGSPADFGRGNCALRHVQFHGSHKTSFE